MYSTFVSLIAILLQLFAHQINAKRYRSSDSAPSLCDDPTIYAADRLVDNTVRLYRDNHYWELKGIPGTKGFLDGPHLIKFKDFGPISVHHTISTVLAGNRKGATVKFDGRMWYAWNADGHRQWGDHGTQSNTIPKGGFMAVFHNGNLTHPMFIGLNSINVYYINTIHALYPWLYAVGNASGYLGGQFGENFPSDITSAFSYPSTDPEDGYFVYLFKKDMYCFRAAYRKDSSKPCDEWRQSRELFGCDGSPQPERPQPPPQPQQPPPDGNQSPPPDGNVQQPAKEKPISGLGIAVTSSIVSTIFSFFVFYICI